jgi:polyhydroxyalkanoate synthase
VVTQSVPIDAALAAFGRSQFGIADTLRRAQGQVFKAFGLDPIECPYQVIASGPFWRLRDYTENDTAQSLLIVAAPIKRPYIWDLAPTASAIRYCLGRDLHVRLLEWLAASRTTGNNGLTEYAEVIGDCVAKISGERAGVKPFLIGHSLGGTLAAISIRDLVLLGAPPCFQPATSRFRDALVSLVPSGLDEVEPCPGSLLSHFRLTDAAFSGTDGHAMEIHARVERWALDEIALPGKLVHQLIEWLYRENLFCRAALKIGDTLVGPKSVSVPTLAVINTADEVALLGSVKPFIDAMPTGDARIIEYPGENGVCLQHLGILIGREAHTQVWPHITSWIDSHR